MIGVLRGTDSLGKGVLLTTLGNSFPAIVGLATAPLLAQALGVDGRGELAAATAPLILAASALNFGLPDAATYFIARRWGNPFRILGWGTVYLVMAGIIGSLVICSLASALSDGDEDLAYLISLAGLSLMPSLLLGLLRGAAAGRQAWGLVSLEKLVGGGLRLAAIVVMFLTDVLTPINATLAISLTSFCGIVVYLGLPGLLKNANPEIERAGKSVLGFGMSVWAGSLSGILLSKLMLTLMVPLSGTFELGLFAVAISISEIALLFNAAVRDVMYAAESKQNDEERLAAASRLSTLATLGVAISIGILCIWIVPLLFGNEFTGSITVIWILLIGTVLGNPGSVAGAGLNARGRPALRSLSLGIALILNISAALLLVPVMGANGAALAMLAGNVISGYLNVLWMMVFFKAKFVDYLGIRRTDIRVVYGMTQRSIRSSNF